ncbi:hypothetical protein ATE80_05300 [Streptomyces kanasensis]|uniref:Uncharacterized protein n=1 Tax=Streptomyces kanasensis TaxID=936756 RepID=A0A100Y910_9ACTN|nr:hypothetical protein ATE80_05300 [Streptomyces kanasensis]
MTVALGAVSGCDGQKTAAGGTDALADRARQVAEAWDGPTAAAAWRAGYHPTGETAQLPLGGLRSPADRRAFEERSFVLGGRLPVTWPRHGQVTWAAGGSLTRPLRGVEESYWSLAATRVGGEPHLTVTGAKPGAMRVATTRGPAMVPAWLFTLEGYAAPLKLAAAIPSEAPRPPIGPARDIPGHALDQLVRISPDGRSVTVVVLHGVCDDAPAVGVPETRGSVVLSASVKERGGRGDCTKQAKMQQVAAVLERPVGDRVLLDARTGQPISSKGLPGISPSRG